MATIVANAQLSVSSNGQVTVGDGSIYAVDRTGSDLQKIGVLPSLFKFRKYKIDEIRV